MWKICCRSWPMISSSRYTGSNASRAFLRIGCLLLVALTIAACSTKARVPRLVPDQEDLSLSKTHPHRVAVTVTGGDEQFVSNATFSKAVLTALTDHQVFAKAAPAPASSDYILLILINSSGPHPIGFTHFMRTRWVLVDAGGNELWTEDIEGYGQSNNLSGVKRAQLSAERAAKDVITAGVAKLSALDL